VSGSNARRARQSVEEREAELPIAVDRFADQHVD
jgi:hypothetical protein